MKITMQMTVADLIRTLRWQAMELAEQLAEEGAPPAGNAPKADTKRRSEVKP